ncbi:MAG: hypothetical protein HUU46_10500 [Candidatus Hydrogenedentes bacterium]|nr:hypothetical protein [Candidatus Hydrogenedentota bacterium]
MTERAKYLIGFLVTGIVIGILLVLLRYPGVTIRIDNQTGNQIEDVSILFAGGPVMLVEVANNSKVESRISVTSESSVRIAYSQNGKTITTDDHGYLENGYGGEMTFTLKSDEKYEVVEHIKLPALP